MGETAVASGLPAWAEEMRQVFRAGATSQFVLHGNVFDLVPAPDGKGGTSFVSLADFFPVEQAMEWLGEEGVVLDGLPHSPMQMLMIHWVGSEGGRFFYDLADYPEISGMTGGYAVYMLDSTDEDDMDLLENWLEIAPAHLPCGGKPEKPRFFAQPIVIDPAEATLANVESDDADSVLDLVFRADGSMYEGPYPQSDTSGSADVMVKFKDDTSKPAELSPGFTMETTRATAVDRYAVYLSLFGKVTVFPYHS